MAVKLVFLGRLEDLAGAGEMSVPLEGGQTLTQVLARLPVDLSAALTGPKVKLALNGTLLQPGALPILGDGDEVAFLPTVSGG